MCEFACRLAVYAHTLYAKSFKKTRHDDAANRVYSIKGNLEMRISDCLHIHFRKCKHSIKVSVCVVLLLDYAKVIDLCETKVLSLSTLKDGSTFLCIEELALLVKEFECIPLLRIVGSGKDDASVRLLEHNRHFSGRSGGKTCLHHVHAAGDQCSADKLLHHVTGKTCVLSDYNFISLTLRLRKTLAHLLTVGICKLHDIQRRKALTRSAANCSANA